MTVINCFATRATTRWGSCSVEASLYNQSLALNHYTDQSFNCKLDSDFKAFYKPPQWAGPAAVAGTVPAPQWGKGWANSWCPACWLVTRAQKCAAKWMGTAAPALRGHIETTHCIGENTGSSQIDHITQRYPSQFPEDRRELPSDSHLLFFFHHKAFVLKSSPRMWLIRTNT